MFHRNWKIQTCQSTVSPFLIFESFFSFLSAFFFFFFDLVLTNIPSTDAAKESLLSAQRKIADLEKALADSQKFQSEVSVGARAEVDDVSLPLAGL
jgi:hypothetical protein